MSMKDLSLSLMFYVTLFPSLCKGEKPSAPNKQLALKNDLVVPSPNSTGGSSSTSSISETAIDEELIQVAPDEKIQTSATTNGPNQPVNIMDLLFKAKDRYDKVGQLGQE